MTRPSSTPQRIRFTLILYYIVPSVYFQIGIILDLVLRSVDCYRSLSMSE